MVQTLLIPLLTSWPLANYKQRKSSDGPTPSATEYVASVVILTVNPVMFKETNQMNKSKSAEGGLL